MVYAHAPAFLAVADQFQRVGGAGADTKPAAPAEAHIDNQDTLIGGGNVSLTVGKVDRVWPAAQCSQEMSEKVGSRTALRLSRGHLFGSYQQGDEQLCETKRHEGAPAELCDLVHAETRVQHPNQR